MATSSQLLLKYDNSIKDNHSILIHALNGVDINAFFDLAAISGISKNHLAEEVFDLSLKTISRYKQSSRKLNPRNSEMVLKLLALFKKGIDVFGGVDSFNYWLSKPAFGLGSKVPTKLISTSTGIDLIFEELIRIEYGDLA